MSKNDLSILLKQPLSFKLDKDFILKLGLIAFIITSFTFNEMGLMPVVTILLIIIFLIHKNPNHILNSIIDNYPIEIKLLNFWFLFSFLTGIFIAKDINGFLSAITSLFLIIVMVNLLCCILLYDIRLIKIVFFAIVISGVIQVLSIYLGISDVVNERSGRQMGIASNPNSLGLKMVYASLGVLIFIGALKKNKIVSLFVYGTLITSFLNVILMSGSRKSLLSFFILICLSLAMFIGNKRRKINIKKVVFGMTILVFLAYYLIPLLLEGTVVGERFLALEEKGGIAEDSRFEMYQFGLNLFLENPLLGVGINNYRYYYPGGMYSHSDYIESLTSTGFFGFILYQLVFILLIIKGTRLIYKIKDNTVRLYVVMGVLSIIVLKIIGFGIILYTSPSAMLILALFSVVINKVSVNLK